jgi:hypothetical protein
MILDSSCTSNSGSLLSELCHVETDTALSLSLIINDISLVHHDHSLEHLLHGGIIDTALKLLVNDISIFVNDTEALDFVE